jgi:predicted DNA-binding protein
MDHPERELVTTRLPAVTKKKLEKIATADGLSVAAYVRRLLMQHLKEIR